MNDELGLLRERIGQLEARVRDRDILIERHRVSIRRLQNAVKSLRAQLVLERKVRKSAP